MHLPYPVRDNEAITDFMMHPQLRVFDEATSVFCETGERVVSDGIIHTIKKYEGLVRSLYPKNRDDRKPGMAPNSSTS